MNVATLIFDNHVAMRLLLSTAAPHQKTKPFLSLCQEGADRQHRHNGPQIPPQSHERQKAGNARPVSKTPLNGVLALMRRRSRACWASHPARDAPAGQNVCRLPATLHACLLVGSRVYALCQHGPRFISPPPGLYKTTSGYLPKARVFCLPSKR